MRVCRMLLVGAAGVLLGACGAPPALEVRPLHLRKVSSGVDDDPFVRGEMQKKLYGAVSVAERAQRLGQYYQIEWHDEATGEPVEVVFEYQQGSTGSRVKKGVQRFGAGEVSGRAEFAIIGDDYLKGGRVLAWRCRLMRGERVVAERKSYLWQ